MNLKIKQLTASNILHKMSQTNQEKEKLLVRIFREEMGLTRYDVRQATGIAERTLADIEAGKSIPNADNIIALARLYKKSLKKLLNAMNLDTSGIPDDY